MNYQPEKLRSLFSYLKSCRRCLPALLTSLLFVSLLFTASAFSHQKKTVRQPNIVVLIVDDAGYADFGFMGAKDLSTPNIDALAAQSVKFSDAHVTASVCSPSRAGLLTGRYQQRFGYECNEGDGYTGIDTAQKLMAHYLQGKGYTTAAFGKWHLGYKPGQHPRVMGFDYYYGFLSGGRSYFYRGEKDDKPGSRNALLENHRQVAFTGYLTDVLGEKAAAYIRENKNRPFFMYWSPNAVHTPMEADAADLKKFAGHPRQKLAAMTYALDRAVGNIISTLKKEGIFDNTLLFFLSDNGGAHNNQSNNGALKGFKGNKYEAGHRVPFLLCWPERFQQPRQFEGLTSSLDISATVADVAGFAGQPGFQTDGVSLLPYLDGNKTGDPHGQLVWRKDGAAAVREGDYKLIRVGGLEERLYNLADDPGEKLDIQEKNPAIRQQLEAALRLWESDKIRPDWTEGPVWDTITLMIHDDLMHNRKVRVRNPEELEKFRQKKKQ